MYISTNRYASTGVRALTVGDPSLTGSGALTVITAGSDETIIKSIIIKAVHSTSQGMVRIFLKQGLTVSLFQEVVIDAVEQNATTRTFETTIYPNLSLKPNQSLLASSENSEEINVIVNAVDVKQCDCAENVENPALMTYAETGIDQLDGSTGGSIELVLGSSIFPESGGTLVRNINVKALNTTTHGLVRFFISDGVEKFLFSEVVVSPVDIDKANPSFRIDQWYDLYLKPGYSLYASTDNPEQFVIFADALTYINCPCTGTQA